MKKTLLLFCRVYPNFMDSSLIKLTMQSISEIMENKPYSSKKPKRKKGKTIISQKPIFK